MSCKLINNFTGNPPSTTITSSEDPLAPPLIEPEDANHQQNPEYQL